MTNETPTQADEQFAQLCQDIMAVLRMHKPSLEIGLTALGIVTADIAHNTGVPKEVLIERLGHIFDMHGATPPQDLQ